MEVNAVKTEVKQLLNKYLHAINAEGFTSVLLAHFGEINQDIVNSFTANVEEMMISAGDKKTVVKRVFSILVEGLQNILLHGGRMHGEQSALVIVACNEQHYRIVLGNYTAAGDREKIVSYLEKLNAMEDAEVKEYYMEILSNGLLSSKGGAGLGFITMRIKSKCRIRYGIDDAEGDQVFFTICADLARRTE
jgi:hypothetical protein